MSGLHRHSNEEKCAMIYLRKKGNSNRAIAATLTGQTGIFNRVYLKSQMIDTSTIRGGLLHIEGIFLAWIFRVLTIKIFRPILPALFIRFPRKVENSQWKPIIGKCKVPRRKFEKDMFMEWRSWKKERKRLVSVSLLEACVSRMWHEGTELEAQPDNNSEGWSRSMNCKFVMEDAKRCTGIEFR